MTHRRELEIGRTVMGRPIAALHVAAAGYVVERPPAILFGAIHGDEPLGVHCLAELLAELVAQADEIMKQVREIQARQKGGKAE